MDMLLLTFGCICMIIGVLGSFLPILPGSSISWFGILLLYLTRAVPLNYWILGTTLFVTLFISILDYTIPTKSTKKFGGSTYGIWGTNIGLVAGILTPIPLGFIIGPFFGAFVGELIYDSKNHQRAFRAATGSFVGLLVSNFIKFVLCMMYLGLFFGIVWNYKSELF